MAEPLLVPYAVDVWTMADLSASQLQDRSPQQIPSVAIDPSSGDVLRLNNAPYPQIAMSAETPAPLDHLRSLFHQMCKPWDKLAHAFVDTYLDYLMSEMERDMSALSARAKPFAGLFKAQDWIFSAPRPLPRAHLPVTSSTRATQETDYVGVDFAFWLGTGFVAILSKEHGMSPGKARARLAQLAAAHIPCIEYGRAELREPTTLFEQIFGGPVARFWHMQAIPSGPFPARLLLQD